MHFFGDLKVSKKISLGYAVILALMIAVSLMVYSSIISIINSSKWVNHTYEVIRTAEQVSAALVDIETGLRGFMVTGQNEYLEPYDDGIKKFNTLISKGKQLTSDNPAQVTRWDEVAALQAELIKTVSEPVIKARREANLGADAVATFKKVSSRTVGKDIFDSIRAALADLESTFNQEGNSQAANLITNITLDLVNMETGQRGFLLTGMEISLEPFNNGKISLENNIQRLGYLLSGSAVTDSDLQKLQSKVDSWIAQAAEPEINARRKMNNYSVTIEDIAAMMKQGQGKRLMDAARAKIKEIVAEEEKLIILRTEEQTASSTFGISVTTVGTLLAAILGTTIAFFVVRGIMGPINATNDILKEIAEGQGDLTKRVDVKSADEIGEMADYFNAFISKLQGIIKQVVESAVKVSQAAEQLSQVTTETSEGINRQNSETAQVATAITEMSATVEEVARNTQMASDAAKHADKEAKSGNKTVSITIEKINELAVEVETSANTLEKLKVDSENISAVLDVIKNIAEQTNLLALNAAIEAARAGEQGRGFAVVADEVRTLAQRTQNSTAEIENLISALQHGVNSTVLAMQQNRATTITTVDHAAKTGVVLQTISKCVSSIVDMNTQIAVASEEQSAVAQEISKNIINIQTSSEQTSVGAHQTDQSSRQLLLLGNQMRQLVEQFRV